MPLKPINHKILIISNFLGESSDNTYRTTYSFSVKSRRGPVIAWQEPCCSLSCLALERSKLNFPLLSTPMLTIRLPYVGNETTLSDSYFFLPFSPIVLVLDWKKYLLFYTMINRWNHRIMSAKRKLKEWLLMVNRYRAIIITTTVTRLCELFWINVSL